MAVRTPSRWPSSVDDASISLTCPWAAWCLPETRPGYRVAFAEATRTATGLPVASVGLLEAEAEVADVLAQERADVVFADRAFLRDPYRGAPDPARAGTPGPWPDPYELAVG